MKHYKTIAAGLVIAGMIAAPLAVSQIQVRVDAGHREEHHVIHHYHHHRSRASVRIVVPVRRHVVHPRNEERDRDRHEDR